MTTPPPTSQPPPGSDPIVERLAGGAYGDPWNYLVRDRVIDAIWKEAGGSARLIAIAGDHRAPLDSRFLACEVLFEREFTFVSKVGRDEVASIYAGALVANLTGRANSWGLLYEHDDAGPVGIRFVMIGQASIPILRPLLDDDRRILTYDGSEEATVGNAYGFRIKDFAAYYLSKIARIPITFHRDPADRDRAIAELARALPAAP